MWETVTAADRLWKLVLKLLLKIVSYQSSGVLLDSWIQIQMVNAYNNFMYNQLKKR